MIFAKEPYLLHLLAGSDTMTALDAAKSLLDSGAHNANEREPTDDLAPLHVAAAWDNLAMCQLLIHYGAEIDAQDIDKRRPMDVASGESKRFLKRLWKKRRRDQRKFRKVLAYLFQRIRGRRNRHQSINEVKTTNGDDDWVWVETSAEQKKRKSCPETMLLGTNRHMQMQSPPKIIVNREEPKIFNPHTVPRAKPVAATLVAVNSQSTSMRMQVPSAPHRRSSSIARDEFFTSDNSFASAEQLQIGTMADGKKEKDGHEKDQREKVAEEQQVDDEKQRAEEEALREKFAELNIEDLKKRLRRRNCAVGPMDARNRKIYEAKLAKIEIEGCAGNGEQRKDPNSISQYTAALQKMILILENGEQFEQMQIGRREEAQIRKEYVQSPMKSNNSNGNSKNCKKTSAEVEFFCYLLIDPKRLPNPTDALEGVASEAVPFSFRQFLSAIFYVGKGKRSRPLYHLVQAKKCRDLENNSKITGVVQSAKLKHILDIWNRGDGVISLQLFSYIHSAEAFIREAAMIDAIGVDNLTNLQRGTFTGVASRWTRNQITEFGALLLYKAYVIFQNERCRPFYEADVPTRLDWFGH